MEFKKYSKVVKVNREAVDVEITITIEIDWDAYDGILSDEQGITKDGIFFGLIEVRARALDLIGIDSLGTCELRPNNAFSSIDFNLSVSQCLADHTMEFNAIADLKQQLATKYRSLREQAEAFKKFSQE